jgi:hypothetical protein
VLDGRMIFLLIKKFPGASETGAEGKKAIFLKNSADSWFLYLYNCASFAGRDIPPRLGAGQIYQGEII